MNTQEYLEQVAYIGDSDIPGDDGKIYYSNFDGSYITRVGMEKKISFLADREITEELTHGVGYSPKRGKWYGWSHRAICGFKISSTSKKGDCSYKGSNLKEQEEAAIRFWQGSHRNNVRSEGIIFKDGERFFDIKWDYSGNVPNKKLRNAIGGCLHYIESLGRGEWTATTMEEAKIMAQDFNEGVS